MTTVDKRVPLPDIVDYRGNFERVVLKFWSDAAMTVPLAVPTTGWSAGIVPELGHGPIAMLTVDASTGGSGYITVTIPSSVRRGLPDSAHWYVHLTDGTRDRFLGAARISSIPVTDP